MSSRATRIKRGTGLAAAVAVVSAFTVIVSGAEMPEFSGIDQLPLPGGADLGDHPYTVTAEFGDVLSLVPQSAVKVNDVAIGRVTRIKLSDDGWTAKVTMKINGKVKLPADAYARLEQSSLLGEKYVQLAPPPKPGSGKPGEGKPGGGKPGDPVRPDDLTEPGDLQTVAATAPAAGPLKDGSHIPLARTNRNPEVEEVFGALSMLLNGGGVSQLKTITTELGKALHGKEPEIKATLRRIDTLVTNLDTHKGDITRALDGMNRLSATLATRKQAVGEVLTGLSPGLKVLEEQRGSLLTMLRSLDALSTVAVDTVNKSKADMIADLKALAPTLRALADSGKSLPDSLQVLFTYPFTDEVMRGVKGDYLNVYLDATAVPGTQIIPALEPPKAPGTTQGTGPAGTAVESLPLPLPPVGGAR
ncbi:MlaD family protein [Streptomyces sp. NPDC050504]|uniref:MlaD family protein n=1 Tax=Streptomyces sp. NPDC050504 TaxID=3365618 RepID=UPI0037AF48D8